MNLFDTNNYSQELPFFNEKSETFVSDVIIFQTPPPEKTKMSDDECMYDDDEEYDLVSI